MATPSTTYEPRCPAQTALYQIVNLNVQVHALVLDGVFAKDGSGVVGFQPGPRLTALDIDEVLATVEPRIKRLLARRGLWAGDDKGSAPDAWADEAPVLAGLAALAPRAAWRTQVVRRKTLAEGGDAAVKDSATKPARETEPAETARRHARGQTWAALMARTFGIDVLACPRCGGRLRLIALIE